ncbi:MAG: hypothetical protein KatS3mg076_2134 [Candidatus Binatia bacterium]|nr:MAG: hypothetical protein KatS3mg076_2134 [Candidatus Binatia bacterium]
MGKKDARKERLGRGGKLLRAWGVGDEVEALGAALGRDPDADLAIAERLGGIADPRSVSLLLELEGRGADKDLRREVRRSLFRLRQRGLEVPERRPEPPPPLPRAAAGELEGFLSLADSGGTFYLALTQSRAEGTYYLFTIVNDPEGLEECELHVVSRKSLREAHAEMLSKHGIAIVRTDGAYCDARLRAAYEAAVERGATIRGDYLALRARFSGEPPREVLHPALGQFEVGADEGTRPETLSLVETTELGGWRVPAERLAPHLEALRAAERSPIVLQEHLERERREEIVGKAVLEIFGGPWKASYARRLLDAALVFSGTRRPEAARHAVAVARALEEKDPREIPFCVALVKLSLAEATEEDREREAERRLFVVTPDEALAQARRPRR